MARLRIADTISRCKECRNQIQPLDSFMWEKPEKGKTKGTSICLKCYSKMVVKDDASK